MKRPRKATAVVAATAVNSPPEWLADSKISDPDQAAEHYLNDPEGFTQSVVECWRKCYRPTMEQIATAVGWHFGRALHHARTLDALSEDAQMEGGFLIRFIKSVFEGQGFFQALVAYAHLPFDKKSVHPMAEAQRRGENAFGAFVLMKFRESLKEGWSPSQALQIHAESIHQEFLNGNAALLAGLAASVKKPSKKTLNDWILTGWLPLALWQPVSVSVKTERLQKAFGVLAAAVADLPTLPEPTLKNPYPITKLIGTAASKIKNRQR